MDAPYQLVTDTIPSMARGYERGREQGQADRTGRDLLEKIEKAGVHEVPIRMLVIEKDGVGIDDRSVDRLAESAARRGGWIHYPVVQKDSNRVIVGKRRVLADKKAGKTHILVRVVDVTDKEAALWRLEENAVRFNPDKKELYVTFKALRDSFGMKQAEIATASGFSPGRISQIFAWGDGGFKGSPGGKSLESKDSESGIGGYDSAAQAGAGLGEARINETGNAVQGETETHQLVPESAPEMGKRDLPAPDSLPLLTGAGGSMPSGDEGTRDPEVIAGLPPTPLPMNTLAQTLPPVGAGEIPSPAPSFSHTAPDQPFPYWNAPALEAYRGFINSYIQEAIKRKGEEPIRIHLRTIRDAINVALGEGG